MITLVLLYGLNLLVLCQSQCLELYDNTVNATEAQAILDQHNDYRILIAGGLVSGQPKGTNLKRMQWDSSLAAAAQNVSNSCVYAHYSAPDSRWPAVGQNLYIKYSTGFSYTKNWTAAISAWFNENTKYIFSNQPISGTGHYTQVVWANSSYVGCGYSFFKANATYEYQKLYTCNYGPAGNYVGQYPYKNGTIGCEDLC